MPSFLEIRQRFGLSQAQFARVLGVRQNVYSRIERGARLPAPKVLTRLLLHYGVEPEDVGYRLIRKTAVERIADHD